MRQGLIGIMAIGLILLIGAAPAGAQDNGSESAPAEWGPSAMHPGYAGDEPEGQWYCPWCGGAADRGMHRGYMPDQRRGHRQMHRGYGRRDSGYDRGWGRARPRQPINADQARLLVENYLRNTRNPNLKVGEITEKESVYEVTLVTQDDSLVDRLIVDKQTGWFRSAYD